MGKQPEWRLFDRGVRSSQADTRIRDVALATLKQSTAGLSIAQQVESNAQWVEEACASILHKADSAKSLVRVTQDLGEFVSSLRH